MDDEERRSQTNRGFSDVDMEEDKKKLKSLFLRYTCLDTQIHVHVLPDFELQVSISHVSRKFYFQCH